MAGVLPRGRIRGAVSVPGSKSAAIRALALAAMSPGVSRIEGMPANDDVESMKQIVVALGVDVNDRSDIWAVSGAPPTAPPSELDAGESGLSARIAIAMAALVDGEVTVTGRGRLIRRPMGPLLAALGSLGVEVRGGTDHLPVTIRGRSRLEGGRVVVDVGSSTQFLSAILMIAPKAESPLEVESAGIDGASGYVDLTLDLMKRFGAEVDADEGRFRVSNSGYRAADFRVPPDASSAVYPLVGAAITGGEVEVVGLDVDDRQPDMVLIDHLSRMGCEIGKGRSGLTLRGPESLQPIEADMSAAPDGALALAVACLFADGTSTLTGLHTWRHKESDRLVAMSEGLTRLGGRVWTTDNSMEITPVSIRGAVVRSHDDHRIAMSLALASLRLDGVRVEEPDVVGKTWPNFWEALGDLVSSGIDR